MAATTVLRATGAVLRVEKVSGEFEGKGYEFHTARLLVGDADFVDVKVARKFATPTVGDAVDWAVRVDASPRGDGVRTSLVGEFVAA